MNFIIDNKNMKYITMKILSKSKKVGLMRNYIPLEIHHYESMVTTTQSGLFLIIELSLIE